MVRVVTEETRNKISESLKRAGVRPPVGAFRGRKHSEESKRKMSLARIGIAPARMSEDGRRRVAEATRKRLLGKPSPKRGSGNPSLKETKECLHCRKKFTAYLKLNRRYCSLSCSSKATYNHPYRFTPRGADCYNWKGGVSSERKRLYFTKPYRDWRKAVFERDNYTCVWCGQRGGRLNADHIKRWADYPELRFALDNGRTLCEPCHRQTDTYGIKPYTRAKIVTKKLGDYPTQEAPPPLPV